jgi:hypothetical protein
MGRPKKIQCPPVTYERLTEFVDKQSDVVLIDVKNVLLNHKRELETMVGIASRKEEKDRLKGEAEALEIAFAMVKLAEQDRIKARKKLGDT